jgi:hypothetical protein
MSSFRTLRQTIGLPKWLTDGEGGLVGYVLDLLKDAWLERMRLGLLVRFPENGPNGELGPDDARAILGRERRVVPAISETPAQYAARCREWLDDRDQAGSAWVLLERLAEYLGPLPMLRTVDDWGNWYTRTAGGSESVVEKSENWDWSGEDDPHIRWSRFWVIIYPNGLWSESSYDWGDALGPDWGEAPAGTLGSTATPDHVQKVRAIIADWKPLHARCVNVIVAFDPASFDPTAPEPDGLWENWSRNDGGVQVSTRLSTARYFDGVR